MAGRSHYCDLCHSNWNHDCCDDDGCLGVRDRRCAVHEESDQPDDFWSRGLGAPFE